MLIWSRKSAFAAASVLAATALFANPAAAVSTNMTAVVNTTGGDDTFDFVFSPGPTRTVTTVGGTGTAQTVNPSAGNSNATTGNPPVTPAPRLVTLDIVMPAGWTLTGITCDIPNAPLFEDPPIIDVGAGRVTFASPDYNISLPTEVAPRRRTCTFDVTLGGTTTTSGGGSTSSDTASLLASTAVPLVSTGPRIPYLRDRLVGTARTGADLGASRNAARLSTSAVSQDTPMAAWFDLNVTHLELADDVEGRSYVAAAGIDWLLRPDLLAGLMVVADDYEADSDDSGYEADANGAMIGPYFAKVFGDALVLDGRLLYGEGDYTLSSDGTTEGDFDASRLLAQLRLSGEFSRGSWDLRPSADLVYFRTESDDYTDSDANRIAAITHETGRASLGITGYYQGLSDGDMQLTPYVGLAVDHYAASDTVASFEGTSGRLTLGADWALGTQSFLNAEVSTRGIGKSDFSATTAAFAFEMRF